MPGSGDLRTVTFLFTDVVGSTRLWEHTPRAMSAALERHDSLLREAIGDLGGRVFKTMGDAFYSVFDSPISALEAALRGQRALARASWDEGGPLRVRMAIHTGAAESRDDDWFGPPLNLVARLLDVGHGGQILVSNTTRDLVASRLPPDVSLRDLGAHRLRDIDEPVRIHQLDHPDLEGSFPPLRSRPIRRHNLPREATTFVGRRATLEDVCARLASHALITLTGFGGAGKTRVSIEVARSMLDAFPDGVWFVELARLSDPSLVPRAIADAAGITEEPERPVTETLLDDLEGRRTLLLLDNCEHLRGACAGIAEAILERCADVRILATSREPLDVPGEHVRPVAPLRGPDAEGAWSDRVDELTDHDAVRLFVDRARAARPDFEVNASNADAVARLCARLEGIPLAIELVAPRMTILSATQIEQRLDELLRTLPPARRTDPPHHRTLRATIEWSHDLLAPEERALFAHLAVFRGGFDLESAETVCRDDAADTDVLDRLERLVRKSLVAIDHREDRPRFGLLETVRAFALEKLAERDELEALQRRHYERFVELAERAELTGDRQAEWLDRLEREHDNLRAALAWSCSEGTTDSALRLVGALGRFMSMHAHFGEGRTWTERALERAGDDPQPSLVLARARRWAGSLARGQGDLDAAREHLDAALDTARKLGDPVQEAKCLNGLAIVANLHGEAGLARQRWEAALACFREAGSTRNEAVVLSNLGLLARSTGDTSLSRERLEEGLTLFRAVGDVAGISATLNNLGVEAYERGDLDRAEAYHEESLATDRQLEDRQSIARNLGNLALIALDRDDPVKARSLLEEALRIASELRDRSGTAIQLSNVSTLLLAEDRPEEAARLQGAAAALYEEVGAVYRFGAKSGYDRLTGDLRRALGPDAYRESWEAGRAMSESEAIAAALDDPPPE